MIFWYAQCTHLLSGAWRGIIGLQYDLHTDDKQLYIHHCSWQWVKILFADQNHCTLIFPAYIYVCYCLQRLVCVCVQNILCISSILLINKFSIDLSTGIPMRMFTYISFSVKQLTCLFTWLLSFSVSSSRFKYRSSIMLCLATDLMYISGIIYI